MKPIALWVLITGVAVEKLFFAKIAKTKIASECVISDLLESQDIFYPRNFGHLGRKESFSTATGVITSLPFSFAEMEHRWRKEPHFRIGDALVSALGVSLGRFFFGPPGHYCFTSDFLPLLSGKTLGADFPAFRTAQFP